MVTKKNMGKLGDHTPNTDSGGRGETPTGHTVNRDARSLAGGEEMTEAEFLAIGVERFGADPMKFRFICPSCGHIARAEDYKAAGAPESAVAFSCIGRWLPGDWSRNTFKRAGGPCNYAGGGLFAINPVRLTDRKVRYFAFAPPVDSNAPSVDGLAAGVPPLASNAEDGNDPSSSQDGNS